MLVWELRHFCCLQGNTEKGRLRTPGISDFTKTKGYLQNFLVYHKGAERIKNRGLFSPPVTLRVSQPSNLFMCRTGQGTQGQPTLPRIKGRLGGMGLYRANDLMVTAQGVSWALDQHGREGHRAKKNSWPHFLSPSHLGAAPPCATSRLHPSLQIWLSDYIFYSLIHKADYYCSGNSLMSYWAMGRFSSLMVTALHWRHRRINCISVAPKFSSFTRGFVVVVFSSTPRMSLLKCMQLVWHHGLSISLAVKYPLCHQVLSWNQSRNTKLVQ